MGEDVENKIKKLFVGTEFSFSRTDPEFAEIIANFSQDETVKESTLIEKEQMLCILSVLLGCQGMGEFQNMLYVALNTGIDPVAIKEVIYQATAYLGIGRTYDFLNAANQIMEQHGIRLPLVPQATTDENTRFEAGSYSVPIWQKGRQTALFFAGILTAGLQIRRGYLTLV